CASAPRLWPALYEYANAACDYRRECVCRFTQRPVTPDKSSFQFHRLRKRDLFCFPQTSVSCAAKDGCLVRSSVLPKTAWRLSARARPARDRKLRPSRRTRRGMPLIPMDGCLIDSSFVRPDPKRYSARLTLSRRRASLPRRSSTPLTDHWPCRNRILPSTNGQGSPGQLCGLAAKLDDCRSGNWRTALPPAAVVAPSRCDRAWRAR